MEKVELFGGASLVQDENCFPLTQDTVLLSEFIQLKAGEKALDLGCGAGGLWLLVALKNKKNHLDGVEINPLALALGLENQRRNGLDHRGQLYAGDLRQWGAGESYGVCFGNPPYFKGGAPAKTPAKALARNQQSCTLAEFCRAGARLLRPQGRLYFSWPAGDLPGAWSAVTAAGLRPARLRLVHHQSHRPGQLALLCAGRGGGPFVVDPPLILRDSAGGESEEYQKIYRRQPAE